MSRQTIGKTLLRNVIRHTDAHNKIQEEMEMWKMREWEVQTSQRKHLSATASMRGHMHCDQESDPSRHMSQSRVSEHDDREARYWSKQLYEFEAKDPDRWGHSGFKELYPEEFSSDSDSSDSQRMIRTKVKKSKSGKERLSKRSKKSSRKKKKKKKKKEEESKRKKAESGSSDSESGDSGATKDRARQRKRTKSRHKYKKSVKKRRDCDSSSVDSDSEKDRERQTYRRKKRKQDSHKPTDSEPDSKKMKRKDWRAAGEESSDRSSGD